MPVIRRLIVKVTLRPLWFPSRALCNSSSELLRGKFFSVHVASYCKFWVCKMICKPVCVWALSLSAYVMPLVTFYRSNGYMCAHVGVFRVCLPSDVGQASSSNNRDQGVTATKLAVKKSCNDRWRVCSKIETSCVLNNLRMGPAALGHPLTPQWLFAALWTCKQHRSCP